MSFLVAPTLGNQTSSFEVSAVGQKQLHLLLASKLLMEKTGMLRAMSIFHYANDGEIEMDWTVALPPEDAISAEADNLAQQVLSLVD